MTARPNILGYAVLAAFAGTVVYTLTRPKVAKAAEPAPEEIKCTLVTEADFAALESWSVNNQIPLIYLPATTIPPSPERGPLARAFVQFEGELVVVTNDGSFWSYKSGQPQPIPDVAASFCNYQKSIAA
jgi:hypothetical protein